jgi:glutamate-1-semialdehyde 2,1-aminomutase
MTEVKNKYTRSNDLYERALKTIPLASQTFSKSALNLVKGASPLFLESGSGCYVVDVDGNKYIDYVLGLLPVVLGYCDPDVDLSIQNQLKKGISFSLSTELELELSEKLVRLIPCAEQVRFGKNGSDATSAAIRLARAYTGKDKVALCGYHGWHDWYIGTTTRAVGVPKAVCDLSISFPYNDADALESILKANTDEIAAVILEPVSIEEPQSNFLHDVRSLTEKYGVVLIFDEIITGFRIDLGGAQKYYGVTPDLATFGKSLGNGMPISAIVGKQKIMHCMEDIFFSGTFGGEALSLAAAIATLKKIENTNAVERITSVGKRLKEISKDIISKYSLEKFCIVKGTDWWPRLQVNGNDEISNIVASSLLRQELLEQGLLMTGGYNLCLEHDNDEIITDTAQSFDKAMAAFAHNISLKSPENQLRGDPIQAIFQVRPDKK